MDMSLSSSGSLPSGAGLPTAGVATASAASSLNVVNLASRGLTDIAPGLVAKNARSIDLHDNQLVSLRSLDAPWLEELNVSKNRIKSIDALALPRLQSLNVSHNQLSSIQMLRLPSLTKIDLSWNGLRNVSELSLCPSLQHVDLSNNALTELPDFRSCPELVAIRLDSNAIFSLKNVESCIPAANKIEQFGIANNALSDVVQLKYLGMSCVLFLLCFIVGFGIFHESVKY
jgi:centrosomal protein CEP97